MTVLTFIKFLFDRCQWTVCAQSGCGGCWWWRWWCVCVLPLFVDGSRRIPQTTTSISPAYNTRGVSEWILSGTSAYSVPCEVKLKAKTKETLNNV